MRHRLELEALVTLDAATIEAVCADPSAIPAALELSTGEFVTFDELAETARTDGDTEKADFCRQEAAAWRATERALRRVLAEAETGASAGTRSDSGRAAGAA